MPNKLNESTVSLFKNPFDDYNANVLRPGINYAVLVYTFFHRSIEGFR